MVFSPEHRANLDTLASHLEGLPRDYRHFHMATFTSGEDVDEGEYAENQSQDTLDNSCGTVACAVGHGPAAGVLLDEAHIGRNSIGMVWIEWLRYSVAKFCPNGLHWDWMFGGDWDDVDNTHWGAAARIRYLLSGNELPDDFVPHRPSLDHKMLYAQYRIDA